MTEPIHATLAGRDLLPAEHYLDSGYPSAALVVDSLRRWGVTLVTPLLADTSRQARAGAGYDRASFTIDFDTEQATCPQGQTSTWWNPVTQRGTDAIVIKFAAATCRGCPVRDAVHPLHLTEGRPPAHRATRARSTTPSSPPGPPRTPRDWQARYARRAGVEGTIRQAVAVTGMRRARYRGLPKTQPRTRVLRDRTQPDPPGRLLERAPAGPDQNQPPHPPRTRTGRLIELASRVVLLCKHGSGLHAVRGLDLPVEDVEELLVASRC